MWFPRLPCRGEWAQGAVYILTVLQFNARAFLEDETLATRSLSYRLRVQWAASLSFYLHSFDLLIGTPSYLLFAHLITQALALPRRLKVKVRVRVAKDHSWLEIHSLAISASLKALLL